MEETNDDRDNMRQNRTNGNWIHDALRAGVLRAIINIRKSDDQRIQASLPVRDESPVIRPLV